MDTVPNQDVTGAPWWGNGHGWWGYIPQYESGAHARRRAGTSWVSNSDSCYLNNLSTDNWRCACTSPASGNPPYWEGDAKDHWICVLEKKQSDNSWVAEGFSLRKPDDVNMGGENAGAISSTGCSRFTGFTLTAPCHRVLSVWRVDCRGHPYHSSFWWSDHWRHLKPQWPEPQCRQAGCHADAHT